MNLKPKTRALISIIYREYFCDDVQRKAYDKSLKKKIGNIKENLKKNIAKISCFKVKNLKRILQLQTKKLCL